MCGRFTERASAQELESRFQAAIEPMVAEAIQPRYKAAPTQQVPVVVEHSDEHSGERRRNIEMMRWGLVPSWAKDVSIGARMINARSEGLVESKTFEPLVHRRRCLIPADGFYEWKKTQTASGKPDKQPYHFYLKGNGDEENRLYGFAGLWSVWKQPDNSWLHSCTIITTEANDVVAPVHDRMPVILRREDESWWLDPSVTDLSVVGLLNPYPPELMEAVPVSREVGRVSNDFASLVERIQLDAAPNSA